MADMADDVEDASRLNGFQMRKGGLVTHYMSRLTPDIMMQPTPAPSSVPNSPGPQTEHLLETPTYPIPPQNAGSAPFGILVGLFEKLQSERKQDRRRKLIDAWFSVRCSHLAFPI